jgi:hypothetical protein
MDSDMGSTVAHSMATGSMVAGSIDAAFTDDSRDT